jgi:hypothetical protein
MASAAKRKEDNSSDDEKLDLFIAPFQAEYSEAISFAREAKETTNTTAWKDGYKRNIDDHRKCIKHCAESIESTCKSIAAYDTNEDSEKDIKDNIKQIADERIRHSAWHARAVHPFEATAIRCEQILSRIMREASDEERENTLIQHGLVARVQWRIAKWPHVEWNEEEGMVTIDERTPA